MEERGEIDLGVWFRRLVLVAMLLFLGACGIKICAEFWVEYKVGQDIHKDAGVTLKKCAGGSLDDTPYFQIACKNAQRDRAKDPVIYAIEHTWKELWPCKSVMCLEVLVHATRSIWTIVAAALVLTLAFLYFTGCSGIRATPQPMMWACSPHQQQQQQQQHFSYSGGGGGGYSKSVTVDVGGGGGGPNKQD